MICARFVKAFVRRTMLHCRLLPGTALSARLYPHQMSLPPISPERKLIHRRSIDVHVYARDDGLWELDAKLQDTKTRDITLANELRRAGEPVHDMLLRLVIDKHLNILAAGAATHWMPYPGHCDDHDNAYSKLVGLNLLKGFRRELNSRLGGVQGCTHLTELCQVLPTAVIQAFAGIVLDTHQGEGDDKPPFQIDRCHALSRDSEAVKTYYPRWYRKPSSPHQLAHDAPNEASSS